MLAVMVMTSGPERAECHPGQPWDVNVAARLCEQTNTAHPFPLDHYLPT